LEHRRFYCVAAATGGKPMAKSDEYRRYAAECLELAKITDNPTSKAVLLQMAQTWSRLANKNDRRDSTDKE